MKKSMTKVLVATHLTQGQRDTDYCHAKEGELVKFGFECHTDKDNIDGGCGCRRGMVGTKTLKATTTFSVVEMDITFAQFVELLRKSNERAGWAELGLDVDEMAKADAAELLSITALYPVGAVLEKRGDRIQIRRDASENQSLKA